MVNGTPVATDHGLSLAVKRAQVALSATLAAPDDGEVVTDTLRALADAQQALSEVRDRTVVELVRSGIPQSTVALMYGLSRQRLSQLMARNTGDGAEVLESLHRSEIGRKGARARTARAAGRAQGTGAAVALADQRRWR